MLRIVTLVLVTALSTPSLIYAAATSSSQNKKSRTFKKPCTRTKTLLEAAKMGCIPCVEAFLSDTYAQHASAEDSAAAAVDAIDPKNGWTPLHYAAAHGYVVIVNRLIRAQAPLNAVDNEGNTPLHVAAISGKWKTVDALARRYGTNRNAQNHDGDTPLHLAALWGYHKAIKKLFKYNADRTIKNRDDDTAYDLVATQLEHVHHGLITRHTKGFSVCAALLATHCAPSEIALENLAPQDLSQTSEKTKKRRSRRSRHRARRGKKMTQSIEQK